jgi:siroheme synthase-like protein
VTNATLYPLFLKLKDRKVLVVGAGPIAERKIVDFVAAEAKVLVVAPDATDKVRELAELGAIEWRARSFEDADAEDAWLVIAATNDVDVQTRATNAADSRRVFSVAVDDLPRGSAYSAAVVKRAPFVIAISSTGEAPALTRLLREVLEQALPDEDWVDVARELRAKWKREGLPMGSRFADLLRVFTEKAKAP